MTIPVTPAKAGPFKADGAQTTFDFHFTVVHASRLAVYYNDGLITEGFTVELFGTSGRVIFTTPPPFGTIITLLRATPIQQEVDFQNNAAFFAEVIEMALDERAMVDQELAEKISRALIAPPSGNINFDELLTELYSLLAKAEQSANQAELYAAQALAAAVEAQIAAATAPGKEVFEIFTYGVLTPPEGAFPLWTGETVDCSDSKFDKFWVKLEECRTAGTIRILTNAQYEQELSKFGQVGGFVVTDTPRKVRLPKITHYLRGIEDVDQYGEVGTDVQRNVQGEFTFPRGFGVNLQPHQDDSKFASGALSYTTATASQPIEAGIGAGNNRYLSVLTLDTAPIYGSHGGNEVQPAHVCLPLYIQMYNPKSIDPMGLLVRNRTSAMNLTI